METVNTFSKGLNSDISKSKYSNFHYYNALNIQIITSDNLSTGSIVTPRGNRLDITLPNIPEATYEADSETGAISFVAHLGTDLEILGGTSYDNYIILFSRFSENDCQIWRFGYDESTGLINSTELLYRRNLNFRNTNRIKAFVRKESSKFIRLYWNDMNLNSMRTLNLVGTAAEIIETRVRTIDLNSKVNFELPVLKEILSGNLPNGKIGYFYKLISKAGSTTVLSPTSNLIDLNNGNENGLYQFYPDIGNKFKNDEAANDAEKRRLDFSSEKALRIFIPEIDKDYDYIQIGYLLYELADVPTAYLMPYDVLQINGNNKQYEFIHSGNEIGVYPITLEELNSLTNTFDSFQDFIPKHNDLYIANVKNSQFDIDFDARSYRFNSLRQSNIYKENGTLEKFIDGTSPVYPNNTTEETFDAINPYNDENPVTNPDWLINDQYKYKANGTSFGGDGANISYTFVITEHLVDSGIVLNTISAGVPKLDIQNAAPFNNIVHEAVDTANFGIANQNYTGLSKSFSDLKSPYKSSLYDSYARGEVYRFALTGQSENNKDSFVKWIGDIKFPFATDSDDINSSYALDRFDSVTGKYYIRTLGIQWYIANIPSELSSLKIVRVNRDEENQSKLGTGITGGFVKNQTVPFTLDDFEAFVTDSISVLVRSAIGSAAGVFAWIPGTDTIADQISNIIADAITSGLKATVSIEGLFENINPSDFRNIITNALGTVGGNGLINPVALFTNKFADQLADWLFEKIKDIVNTKKVGGIDNIVYSLDNCNIPSGGATPIVEEGTITGKNYGYIISPINQFDKYKYKTGDYLVPLSSYEYNFSTSLFSKYIGIYHRDTNVGIFNRTHSTAKFRKWYNPVNLTTRNRLTIDLENTLDVGEILVPNQISGLPDGTFVNSYFGRIERLTDAGTFIGALEKLSVRTLVQGMGDKKHFIKTSTNFPTLVDPINGIYKIFDQQGFITASNKDINNVWYGLFPSLGNSYNGIAFPSEPGLLTVLQQTRPNVVDSSGNFLVSYERYLTEQYGGNSYTDRTLNKYIPVLTIPKSAFSNPLIVTCYGGDTYVGLYDSVNYAYYMEQIPGYDKAGQTKKASGELFPAEAPFNFNVREGQHFNVSASTDDLEHTERKVKRALKRSKRRSKRSGLDFNEIAEIIIPKRFLYDSHIYDNVYHQKNTIQLSFPRPLIDIFTDTNTNRIYKSEPKLDGELIDSWKIFKPLSKIDVEGIYGPITSIHINKDRLHFYQNNAFGIVTTNEREAVQSSSGTLEVASSKPLSSYDYISTETGCSHTFGVVATDGALFHFDINNKKLFEFSGGLKPLSDIEGLNGYFKTQLVNGSIVNTDQTLITNPLGLHGIYDSVNNRVYFTFLNIVNSERSDFTINYNLLAKCFESFHSFTPGLYIRTPKRLLSIDSSNKYNCYQHNIGDYNSYYGVLHPSTITILNNNNPKTVKTFDNHLIFTEVTNSTTGQNLVGETINQLECTNDYQQSGLITLTPGTNLRRMDRKWHLQIPRDINPAAYTTLQSRLSDTYLLSKFIYNNPNNRRLVLHDIYTDYRESTT